MAVPGSWAWSAIRFGSAGSAVVGPVTAAGLVAGVSAGVAGIVSAGQLPLLINTATVLDVAVLNEPSVMTRSGKPSRLKSPTANPEAKTTPDEKFRALWKPPWPLPRNTLTAPGLGKLLLAMAVTMSRLPSRLKSATATAVDS